MPPIPSIRGVLAPVITPFDRDLRPDPKRLASHCRWLVTHDVGLAVFGTNSEANSLTLDEKLARLAALLVAGLPPARMMPGTGCCAVPDTVELTRRAVVNGCAGVLMLPPFYYKNVSDDGLFASFAEVIERVGDPRLRIYLYHIPQVSNVPITLTLIERLLAKYPGIVAGVKDSSGEWSNTRSMLERFQPEGFDVFSGSETYLLATLRGGGAGCISGVANVNAPAVAKLAQTWKNTDAEQQQAALDKVRAAFLKYMPIPALKAVLAHHSGNDEWGIVRPPLMALTAEQRQNLIAALVPLDFSMPGLRPS